VDAAVGNTVVCEELGRSSCRGRSDLRCGGKKKGWGGAQVKTKAKVLRLNISEELCYGRSHVHCRVVGLAKCAETLGVGVGIDVPCCLTVNFHEAFYSADWAHVFLPAHTVAPLYEVAVIVVFLSLRHSAKVIQYLGLLFR
jgi:hypothetical protein